MFPLTHAFINYVILSFLIPNTEQYLIPIAFFSMVLDLDHIPGMFRYLRMTKLERKKTPLSEYAQFLRTAIQEPIGIFILLLVLGFLYLAGITSMLLIIAALCFLFHWVVDFLTVQTCPLDPFDKRAVSFLINSKRMRVISEIFIGAASIILFVLVF